MEPPVKQRRVWLKNDGRIQDVDLEVGALGVDLRRKAEPTLNDKERAYVRPQTEMTHMFRGHFKAF